MSVTKVEIKTLTKAKWNPPKRMEDINALAGSIERVGLLCPLLITKDKAIVDGHRRLAACKKLGWTDVPVITVSGDHAAMFAEVNTSARRLTGNQSLHVYLVEPNAISVMLRNRIAEFEEEAGRAMVERAAREGFSIGIWQTAKKIAYEADQEDFVLKILRWLMKYRCSRLASKALAQGTPPSKLIAAVKNDKPIRVSYAAA